MKKFFPLIFIFLFISCYHSVTLHVSSQSSVPGTELGSPVDIQVLIDEEEIVNDEFFTNTGHSWKTYNLNLSSGTHTIIVKSNAAGAVLDTTFTVDKPIWLILDYAGRQNFRLKISEHPVVFI